MMPFGHTRSGPRSRRTASVAMLFAAVLALAGCQSRSVLQGGGDGEGGYFGGDRPPDTIPVDLASIPDAVPVALPRSKTGNKPYEVLGRTWRPLSSAKGYRERGVASWYGRKFHGRRTSSGETYDMFAMTAAHPVLPLPTFVRVTSLDNDRSIVVKVNDRGPFLHGRLIDLSYAAAWKLGITKTGTGRVEVEALDPSGGTVPVTGKASDGPSLWTGVAGTPTATIPVREPTADGRYVVQVGSFNDLVNALELRGRLRLAGYALLPVRDEELAGQGAPFRVLVGPYDHWGDADRVRLDQERITGLRGLLREI